MNEEENDDMAKTVEEFLKYILEVLEVHGNALSELYKNQDSIYEAMKRLSDRNDQLMQAIMRADHININ